MRSNASMYSRCSRGVQDLYRLKYLDHPDLMPFPDLREKIVIWIAGATGCGKSKLAEDIC